MKKKRITFVIIFILIIISRLILLDADLPSARLTMHVETDQFSYTNPALSAIDNGKGLKEYAQEVDNIRIVFDVFQNLWTYPFLKIIGDNFWGFKLPVALLSLLMILLMMGAYQRLIGQYNDLYLLLLVFIGVEYMFFITSRVQNPTIYSYFIVSLLVYLLVKTFELKSKNRYWFLLGLTSVSAVFLVYVYNIYMFSAISFSIFILLIKKEVCFKQALCYVGGILAGFAIYNLIIYVTYDKTIVDLFQNLKNFGGNDNYRFLEKNKLGLIEKLKMSFAGMFTWNALRFNLFLIPLVLVTLLNSLLLLKKKANLIDLTIISSFVFMWIMIYFEPHSASKKINSIFPVIILGICRIPEGVKQLKVKEDQKIRLLYIATTILGSLFAIYVFKITTANWYEQERWGENTSVVFNVLNLTSLAVICMCLFLFLSYNKSMNKLKYILPLILTPSLYMSASYISNCTFKLRDSLISFSKISKGKNVAGESNKDLMLFNSFEPKLNMWVLDFDTYEQKLDSLLSLGKIDYVNFQRKKPNKEGYNFEERYKVNAANKGDQLWEGSNYRIVVEQILDINQGKTLYIGKRVNN